MVVVVEAPDCQAYLQALVVVEVVDPDQWVRQEVDLAESVSGTALSGGALGGIAVGLRTQDLTRRWSWRR